YPGTGAPAAVAARAGSPGRPEYGRFHFRVPRLAAGYLRPGTVAGAETAGTARHPVPARGQRGPGRYRRVGDADPGLDPQAEEGWRICYLVRQGPGRGPLRRPLQAWQPGRYRPQRRRADRRRGRPLGQILDRGAPERGGADARRHADPGTVQRARRDPLWSVG